MVSNRFWRDREAERKSGRYAATLTFVFVLAVNLALLWPRSVTLAVPLGNAPLRVEIRRMPPQEPQLAAPEPPKSEVRKLLHETPESDRLIVPEPPFPPVVETVKPEPPKVIEPPKPVVEPVKKPVKKEVKPRPKPQPQMPLAPVAAAPSAPASGEAAADGVPGQAGQKVGHASGQAGVAADDNGAIVAALLHAVDARKEYPRQARRAGVEGKVVLRVTLGGNGRITVCALAESSGKKLLDAAAEKLGAALVGLDVPAARGKGMTVRIPVRYALKK